MALVIVLRQYDKLKFLRIKFLGNSLAVQWLGLGTFTAVAQVQSLVRELRSRKPQSVATKKRKKRIKFLNKMGKMDL